MHSLYFSSAISLDLPSQISVAIWTPDPCP